MGEEVKEGRKAPVLEALIVIYLTILVMHLALTPRSERESRPRRGSAERDRGELGLTLDPLSI